ncbi:hypothetical protein [Polyangium spumosum]|uniref:Uncharacterized protein n=1 Tax=Polyangium spumosum TaxID=889282 RepID=A0A6N7PQC6_9BACT|nr:hypothetical protein [Polyangium spumosum]MRG94412.1 hypothetical protein [Polyangium spumosum]
MPDVLAIVSKAVFEKEAGGRKPGKVWPIDTYHSQSKGLAPLAAGGRIFMVTVRPPSDTLWLVAVLENPQNTGKGWRSGRNRVAISDITSLVPRLRFANGKGINAAPGTLGMSLQTPRVLDAPSAALLLGQAFCSGVAPAVNVTKHDTIGPLPCLCKLCLPQSAERAETGGMAFVRSSTEALGRVLHYWIPEELQKNANAVGRSVRSALASRLAAR